MNAATIPDLPEYLASSRAVARTIEREDIIPEGPVDVIATVDGGLVVRVLSANDVVVLPLDGFIGIQGLERDGLLFRILKIQCSV